MTFSLPLAMMYSALMSSSLMVPARPRFKRMGLSVFPSSLSISKFWVFLAPTWMMSTSSKRSRVRMSMSSVTMGRPVARLASSSSRMPSAPRPWKS